MHMVYEPERPLRYSRSSLLAVPQSKTKASGDAAFSHYDPSRWNSLTEDHRGAETIAIFKQKNIYTGFL